MTVPAPEFLALQAAVAGRFSLSTELGRGGMGIVYLARDVLLERHVAIKLLAPHLAAIPEMRRRFLREARTAAACFHPHIVPIHGVEEAGELAFFVMAYVEGETLADRIARVGALPAAVVGRVGREIGWALAYAHDRGVVHRDVKPANILIESGTERALITDFGIALRDDGATPSPDVAGTARFMAPEQALGEAVDGRADLYALGVTLYLAATGRYPHDGANAVAILASQATSAAPSVRFAGARLPDALADAIDRCLARDPGARFANAAAFVAAIDTGSRATLSPRLAAVSANAIAALGLAGWTAAGAATTALVAAGESGFGRSLVLGIGGSLVLLTAVIAAVRAGEAMVAARRAARSGTSGDEIVRAVAGEPSSPHEATGSAEPTPNARSRGVALLLLGAVLALAEGRLSDIPDVDGLLGSTVQIALLVLPLLLIARGGMAALSGSRLARIARERVLTPLARAAARWTGAPARNVAGVARDDAPTELQLDRAADAILARLPDNVRAELRAIPAAVEALAGEAMRLRALDAMLVQRERAARGATGEDARASLEAVLAGRAEVRGRLGATIGMLESVRLDLLRVEQGELAVDGLTTHLDAVQALQHRVDAAAEVHRLLNRATRGSAPAAMDATPA